MSLQRGEASIDGKFIRGAQRSANPCAVWRIVGFLYNDGLAVVEQKVSLAS